MKKVRLFLMVIVFFIVTLIGNICFADVPTNDISVSIGNDFISPGNKIIGLLQAIGIIVSVIALMIIGIRYMTGSIEEKAEYKKTLPYYLIGAILVGGIIPLAKFVYDLVQEVF